VRQHSQHTERDIVLPILPVCPMPVLCLNICTYRHTFWYSGRSIILVLSALQSLQNSDVSHSARALNTRGWENLAIFDRNRRLSRKRSDISPYGLAHYWTLVPRYPNDPCWLRWSWVTLKDGTRGVKLFQEDLRRNYAPIVWPRSNKFGRVTHVGGVSF